MKFLSRNQSGRWNGAGCCRRGLRDVVRRTLNGNKTGAITRESSKYDSDEYRVERLALAQRFERKVHQAGGSMISGMKFAFKQLSPGSRS